MAEPSRPGDERPAPVALEVVWGVAAVPGFAPVGAESACYGAWRWGPAPLPEVIAHHAAHWPEVTSMEGFAPKLSSAAFDPAAMAAVAQSLGAPLTLTALDDHPAVADVAARLAGIAGEEEDGSGASGATVFQHRLPRLVPAGPWVLRRPLGSSFAWNAEEAGADILDATGLAEVLARTVSLGGRLRLVLPLRGDGSLPSGHVEVVGAFARWLDRNLDAFAGADPFDVSGDDEVRYTSRPGAEPGTRDVFLVDLLHRPRLTIGHFSPHRYPMLDVRGAAEWRQDPAGIHLDDPSRAEEDVRLGLPVVYRLTVRDRRLVRLSVTGQRTAGRVSIGGRPFAAIGEALAAARPGDVVVAAPGRFGVQTEAFPLRVPAGVTLRGVQAGEVTEGAPLGLAPGDEGTVLDGGGAGPGVAVVVLAGGSAAVEGLTIRGWAPSPEAASPGTGPGHGDVGAEGCTPPPEPPLRPLVVADGVDGARVERCTVLGDVAVTGGAGARVSWNRVVDGAIHIVDAERATVTGNVQRGCPDGVGLRVHGGGGHRIDGNHLDDDRVALHVSATVDAVVSGNDARGSWCAVHVEDAAGTEVVANRLRGMRGLTVVGCRGTGIRANLADGNHTGILSVGPGTELGANRFDDCRTDVLDTDALGGPTAQTVRERNRHVP